MPFTGSEALSNVPGLLDFVLTLQDEVAKLPDPATLEDYGKLVAAVAPSLGKLADKIKADIED